LEDVYKLKLALSTVHTFRPVSVVNGKANTCLCPDCEDTRLIKKAVVSKADLLDRPILKYKYCSWLILFRMAYKFKELCKEKLLRQWKEGKEKYVATIFSLEH
jgi:hypothetical protein